MRYEIRPLGPWTGPTTVERQPSGRFRTSWHHTLELLGRETELLGAQLVVVQVDVRDGDIRRDGMLTARAKVGFPGVRVSFDSIHGPLTDATDTYEQRWPGDPPGWQANTRAIALGLQALRAVDRYGITRSGEQYRGWTAIEGGSAIRMSTDVAARLLAEEGGTNPRDVIADPDARARAYKRAAAKHHPDAGCDADFFLRLTAAREALDTAAGISAGGTR
jgi:hypothetical protein